MPEEMRDRSRSLRVGLLALAAVIVLSGAALTFLGTQVSGILLTVGASVGGPGSQAGGGQGSGQDGGSAAGGGSAEGEGGGNGSGGGSAGGGASGEVPLLDVTRPELLIIKTGEITLQVDDLDASMAAATRVVDGLGGYVSGSSLSDTDGDATASATFRIPVAAWDDALIAIRGLGIKVLDEHSGTEDVTGDVVDIEARIRNLRVTEAAFQSIMSSATAIKDVLTVQHELTTVRGEIEELQSQASHLRGQAAMSTLTVRLGLKPAPVVAQQEAQFDAGTEADAATAHLVSVGQAVAKVGIWFGIVWLPILAVLAAGSGVGLFVYRRLHRGAAGEPAAVAGAPGP